jgi:alpha-tubulin suppressor-like RCC1 family protein
MLALLFNVVLIGVMQVWSWGINDNASLGRPTTNVPDPDNPEETLEDEILETQPMVIQTLVDENFRAVDVSAGDSVSVALGHEGDLRVWGSFRVSISCFHGLNFKIISLPCSPRMVYWVLTVNRAPRKLK